MSAAGEKIGMVSSANRLSIWRKYRILIICFALVMLVCFWWLFRPERLFINQRNRRATACVHWGVACGRRFGRDARQGEHFQKRQQPATPNLQLGKYGRRFLYRCARSYSRFNIGRDKSRFRHSLGQRKAGDSAGAGSGRQHNGNTVRCIASSHRKSDS